MSFRKGEGETMSRKISAILGILLLLSALPAGAASNDQGRVELTPFAGYRFGGEIHDVESAGSVEAADGSSYGVMLDFEVEPSAFVEIRYSLQATQLKATNSVFGAGQVKLADLDVEHYMLGGTYQWESKGVMRPFVSADLGAVRFAPSGFGSDTRLAFSIGGGVKLPMAKHLGLRFDARWVTAFFSSNSEIFCNGGSCLVLSSGT